MRLDTYIMPPEATSMAYFKICAFNNTKITDSQIVDVLTLILLEYLN
jgi:hypothetical protein